MKHFATIQLIINNPVPERHELEQIIWNMLYSHEFRSAVDSFLEKDNLSLEDAKLKEIS